MVCFKKGSSVNFSKLKSNHINSSAKHPCVTSSYSERKPSPYKTLRLLSASIWSALAFPSSLLLLSGSALALSASVSLQTSRALFLLRALILDCSKSWWDHTYGNSYHKTSKQTTSQMLQCYSAHLLLSGGWSGKITSLRQSGLHMARVMKKKRSCCWLFSYSFGSLRSLSPAPK